MTRAAPEAGRVSAAQAIHQVQMMHRWTEGAVTRQDMLKFLQESRGVSPESSFSLDDLLLRHLETTRQGLLEARSGLDEMQKLLNQYGAAPLMPAIYLYPEETRHGRMALVAAGNGRRVVSLAKEVDGSGLRCGDLVYLSADQSVLVAAADAGRRQGGEIAAFDRYTADGRIVLKSRSDDQIVVEASSALDDTALKPGDSVRWDRTARLCLEKMETAAHNPYLLQQVEEVPLERIGGQKGNLRKIRDALLNSLIYPDRARRYRLPCSNTLLLYGPPGNGKTCMTRAVFSEIQRLSGKKVFLAVVKASQWESMWVGQTQANIAALFSSMRRAADEGHIAVLFIDEIEAVGRIRGNASGHHSDKALSALLNEMNGFQELQNVSLIGACNRKDLLDAALLSRFGDEIPVRRPDMPAAREIFAIHLEGDLMMPGAARRRRPARR